MRLELGQPLDAARCVWVSATLQQRLSRAMSQAVQYLHLVAECLVFASSTCGDWHARQPPLLVL